MKLKIYFKDKKELVIDNVFNNFQKHKLYYILSRTDNHKSKVNIFPINENIVRFEEIDEEKDIYRF